MTKMSAPRLWTSSALTPNTVAIGRLHSDLLWTNPLRPSQAQVLEQLHDLVHRRDELLAVLLVDLVEHHLDLLHGAGDGV